MKGLVLLLWAALGTQSASPSPDDAVTHAAATVARLHDGVLDPLSFVLDGAYITKPDRKGGISYCYAYRAHNKMGGYSEGRAVEWAADKGRLSTYSEPGDSGTLGYDAGWIAPCKQKNISRDITAEVAKIAPSLYKKDR